MKREVNRNKQLPAFSIGLGELELLWNRMTSLFDEDVEVYGTIEIILPNEKIEFRDIAELKQYQGLPARVTDFTLWFSHDRRSISIRSSGGLYPQPVVRSSSETEVWCAGAIEATHSYFQSNKVWYHWVSSVPLGWFLMFLMYLPVAANFIFPERALIDGFTIISWLSVSVALGFLYVFRSKLFPSTVLRLSEKESFIRRYIGEIGLAIALGSAVLTVVGWFVST